MERICNLGRLGPSALVRTAVIDIGTNTLLLLVTEMPAPGVELEPVEDLCRFGRLGQGLDKSGVLAQEAIARSLTILHEYAAVIARSGATRLAVVGTQALREARNAGEFIAPAEAILGARIEVIEGAREAALVHAAVARSFPALANTTFAIADVGGGSTEVIRVDAGRVARAVSIPIGAVRLAERHLATDPPTAAQAVAMIADIDAHLERTFGGVSGAGGLPRGVPLVASAGTATTMAAVHLKLIDYDATKVHGLRLSLGIVERMLAQFLDTDTLARRAMRGMEPQRADVIPAGAAILARLMARMSASEMVVCDRGVRWGLAYELAAVA